ncbi:hypothetical protein BKA56DRAFT_680984 [Ilyonectria sp. MPI-CAGE-AT-0026]|nr:hypothetical protein BKA56DRAFT_680984 [Ilyonectria sp. MPI-CAGE-AT-0026]
MPISEPVHRSKADSVIYVNPHKRKPATALVSPNGREHRRIGSEQASKAERSISFEDVFQDGHATIKYIIVRFPAGEGPWYILRCDKHDLNFKNHPIKGAATHLGGKQHGRMSREPAVAIKYLGVKVLNCNKILAERNNVAALEALQKGHKHPITDIVGNEPQGDLISASFDKAPAQKTQGELRHTA